MAAIAPPRTARRRFSEEKLSGYLFISPWIIGFMIFTAGPIIASIYFSFTNYDVVRSPNWTGLDNYRTLLTDDPLFWKSLANTFIYTAMYVPLHVLVALGLALLLNRVSRAQGIFRTVYYLPSLTPVVASAYLWLWILNPNDGLLNRTLRFVQLPAPAWTVDPFWLKPTIVIQSLWGFGGAMIIFLAGIKGIPASLYEAAELDGANSWQRFRNVTLPMLSGVTFFVTTVAVINGLQVFTQGYVMYDKNGGTKNAALFAIMYLFKQAFEYFHVGYASAIAWLLFLVILALTLIQFRVSRRWVSTEVE